MNSALYARASSTTTGYNNGLHAQANGGARNYGVLGDAQQPKVDGANVGVAGFAYNTASSARQIGGLFGLYGPATAGADIALPNPAGYSGAALVADNGDQNATTPVARFLVGGLETAQISRLGNFYAEAFNMATTTIPFLVDRNNSSSVHQIAVRTANGATTLFGVDPAGREQQLESTTPSAVTDSGFHYTKQAASGRTEFYYLDNAGVETQLTNLGALAVTFANPTASVILTAVNGSATTAMRSDAAPPLSQAIAPTWTAQHIYLSTLDANSVILKAMALQTTNTLVAHYYDNGSAASEPWLAFGAGDGSTNFGMLKMGYLGSGNGVGYIQAALNATDAADGSKAGLTLDIATTLVSARAFVWTNSVVGRDYFVIGNTGHIAFGYQSGLVVDTNAAVTMSGTTTNDSTLYLAYGTTLQHDNTVVTPAAITGVAGVVQVGQATNVPTNGYAGSRFGVSVIFAGDSAGASGVELAAVVAQLGVSTLSGPIDRPTGASSLRGNWLRASSLRASFIGSRASGPGSTTGARPLILSSVYAPISPYVDGTTGQSWGVEISSPTSTFPPTITPIAGGIKIVHPLKNEHANYATRGMHAYFKPYALAAGGFSGNIAGDVSFDDGTNNSPGLYQHVLQWGKIVDDASVVFYDDELVFSDDEFVYE
jgi:hypothetical protein